MSIGILIQSCTKAFMKHKQTNMKLEFFFKIKSVTLWSPVTANVALLDQKCSNMTWPHRLSFSIVFVIMDTHSIGVHETKTNMKLELFFKIKFITLWMPVTANVALLDRKCSKMTWPHRLSFSIVNALRNSHKDACVLTYFTDWGYSRN